MATKKTKTDAMPVETAALPIQPEVVNKRKYVVIEQLNGLINKTKFVGKVGQIIEMEPWQAKLLRTYVKEV